MKAFPDTLMMFSGGLDSTFCLWQRVQQGQLTHVHHVHYQSTKNRREVEARAVDEVLHWMRSHGGRGLIDYTESWVDLGWLWTPYNFFLWSYWVGAILASPSGFRYRALIRPATADDHGVRQADDAYLTMMQLMAGRTINLEHPILHMTKRDIVAAIPEPLLEMVWWCSQPYNGRPCHVCDSCKLMDAALRNPVACARPPAGWSCGLPGGHGGPCAATKEAP